jgi:hypothetical protein
MRPLFRNASFVVLGAALVLVIVFSLQAADKRKPAASKTAPNYTVVNTDGQHLIVVNNRNNTLYFYAIDSEAKIGDDLKLRGSLDLTGVGKDVLKPVTTKAFEGKEK